MLLCLLVMLAAAWCQAQQPAAPPKPLIENTGKPIRVPFTCGEEDIRAAGLTCPPHQPCAVYLELSSVEVVGNRIFAAGNLHTEGVTFSSILLASDDGGRTWSEPHSRITAAGLDQIQFLDLETGWISGQTLSPMPRDPFVLLTRDGGKTWRQRAVTEESRSGVIDSLLFDSRTHGLLWIDRGAGGVDGNRWEAYESMTGGESWSLREMTGQRPKARPGRASPASSRVRADAAQKAYRIEVRAAAGWQPAASFTIRAGECREPEVTFAEPDPTPAPEPPKPDRQP